MSPAFPDLAVEARPGCTPLYCLSGPTASGKTSIAHHLAEHYGFRLLSVDSMMVYRGMDIGTAKPTKEEQETYRYAGVNLVGPEQSFSVGDYVRAINAQLDDQPTIAVGGTGLYFKALAMGLEGEAATDPKRRQELEMLSVAELQALLGEDGCKALADPENPRRLVRAVEQQEAGADTGRWAGRKLRLPVLEWPKEQLQARMEQRIGEMLDEGWIAETEVLAAEPWGLTGKQAIGYAEILAWKQGEFSWDEMRERILIRTRQYAKRQRTWQRNQWDAQTVVLPDTPAPEQAVAAVWAETGPVWLRRENDSCEDVVS